MPRKSKPKKESNPEFERVQDAFKKILAVPKEKIDEIEKRRSTEPPEKSEKECD
jgi:hypothetical protein